MEAGRDDQDRLGRMLTPSLYGTPERLQEGRAKVANGEGVTQTRMDGEDQRQAVEPGGRRPYRDDGEVFAEVNMHHIGPCGKDRGDDCRLRSVELAKAPQGDSHSYQACVVAKAL